MQYFNDDFDECFRSYCSNIVTAEEELFNNLPKTYSYKPADEEYAEMTVAVSRMANCIHALRDVAKEREKNLNARLDDLQQQLSQQASSFHKIITDTNKLITNLLSINISASIASSTTDENEIIDIEGDNDPVFAPSEIAEIKQKVQAAIEKLDAEPLIEEAAPLIEAAKLIEAVPLIEAVVIADTPPIEEPKVIMLPPITAQAPPKRKHTHKETNDLPPPPKKKKKVALTDYFNKR
jgi:beta-phosphoglucomutase-like phosphatase (HAD superfamily)